MAAEVYGEDAVRVTPPPALATNLASTGDEVEGPNGECPPVSGTVHLSYSWGLAALQHP